MWRAADPAEDDAIVAMCLALNAEDPGQPVGASQVRRTLSTFRADPVRGRALVATDGDLVVGYALLASFWSNEYGGEIVAIDELYVAPSHRGQGLGTLLFESVATDRALWPREPVALELEVTPSNARARALYERLGFRARNSLMRRRVR
jgi:ribosomal protein S18 acetylase RimI-like enzyme